VKVVEEPAQIDRPFAEMRAASRTPESRNNQIYSQQTKIDCLKPPSQVCRQLISEKSPRVEGRGAHDYDKRNGSHWTLNQQQKSRNAPAELTTGLVKCKSALNLGRK